MINYHRTYCRIAFIAAIIGYYSAPCIKAAEYKQGFRWDWEADFTVFDSTPGDYGSVNLVENLAKSTGAPAENIWLYGELETTATSSIRALPEFKTYYDDEGYAWRRSDQNVPAVGIDAGPTYHFQPPFRGRHFLIPQAATPSRDTVALQWICPQDGLFDLEGKFVLPELSKPSCKDQDGVRVAVTSRNQLLLKGQTIRRNQELPFIVKKVSLRKGESIVFSIAAGANQHCDETVLNLKIVLAGKFVKSDADVGE